MAKPAPTPSRQLLDTHVFLWWLDEDTRLTEEAREMIGVSQSAYVGIVSAWGIAVKISVGKLRFPRRFEDVIKVNDFDCLALCFTHMEAIRDLPLHHRDPFDRMPIVQAMTERLTLITADRRFAPYPCDIAWV